MAFTALARPGPIVTTATPTRLDQDKFGSLRRPRPPASTRTASFFDGPSSAVSTPFEITIGSLLKSYSDKHELKID